jgi:ribosomal protein S6
MAKYELTYIISSDIEKNKLESIHQEILELIKKNEGKISETLKSVADFEVFNREKKETVREKNQTENERNFQEQESKSEQFFTRKKLAYPIGQIKSAYYATINFEIEPLKIKVLEEKLRLEEIILRHLIIKKEIKKAKRIRERKIKKEISLPDEIEKETEKETIEKAEEISKPVLETAQKDEREKSESEDKPKTKKKKKIKLEDIQEKLDKILDI